MLLTTLLFIEQPKTIIFIVLILVLFFGAKRIPELFKGIGQGVREFKDASTDANKAPQTHQPYAPSAQAQAPYGQPGQQPYPTAGQPGYPQPPYGQQPGQYPQPYPTQQPAPAYGQPQPYANQTPPAGYDNNSQPTRQDS